MDYTANFRAWHVYLNDRFGSTWGDEKLSILAFKLPRKSNVLADAQKIITAEEDDKQRLARAQIFAINFSVISKEEQEEKLPFNIPEPIGFS